MITLKTFELHLPEGFLNSLFEQYNDHHHLHRYIVLIFLILNILYYEVKKKKMSYGIRYFILNEYFILIKFKLFLMIT